MPFAPRDPRGRFRNLDGSGPHPPSAVLRWAVRTSHGDAMKSNTAALVLDTPDGPPETWAAMRTEYVRFGKPLLLGAEDD